MPVDRAPICIAVWHESRSRVLGPGLLEAPYEECLCHELVKRGFKIERQKPLPLVYGDVKLACAYRMDIVVEGSVIIEVKSVEIMRKVNAFPE